MARITIELPQTFIYHTDVPVRISDVNYGGHLGNDAVFSLVHEARLRFLQTHGHTELNIGGTGLVVADAAVVYRALAYFGDLLRISLAVENMTRHGCEFIYQLFNQTRREETARAKTGIVFFNYQTQKVAAVPEAFLTMLTV